MNDYLNFIISHKGFVYLVYKLIKELYMVNLSNVIISSNSSSNSKDSNNNTSNSTSCFNLVSFINLILGLIDFLSNNENNHLTNNTISILILILDEVYISNSSVGNYTELINKFNSNTSNNNTDNNINNIENTNITNTNNTNSILFAGRKQQKIRFYNSLIWRINH